MADDDLEVLKPGRRCTVRRGTRAVPGVSLGERIMHESRYVRVHVPVEGVVRVPREDVEGVHAWPPMPDDWRQELDGILDGGVEDVSEQGKKSKVDGTCDLPEFVPDDEDLAMVEVPQDLGQKIRDVQERYGASLSQIGRRCGVNATTVGVLRGGKVLDGIHAKRVAFYLSYLESLEAGEGEA